MKPIQGSQIYSVTETGQIFRSECAKIKPSTINGFKAVSLRLCTESKRKTYLIHRLVYEAYVGPIQKGHKIVHIDGNRDNNAVDNLKSVNAVQGKFERSVLSPESIPIIKFLLRTGYDNADLALAFRVPEELIDNILI